MNDLISRSTALEGVPVTLKGVPITYERMKNGFKFCIWTRDRDKAVEIMKEIVTKIKSEYDDPKHFMAWKMSSIDMLDVSEHYGFVLIWWEFYIRDAGLEGELMDVLLP